MSEQTEVNAVENTEETTEHIEKPVKRRGRPPKSKDVDVEPITRKRKPKLEFSDNSDDDATIQTTLTLKLDKGLTRRVVTFLNHYNCKVAIPNGAKPKALSDIIHSALLVYISDATNGKMDDGFMKSNNFNDIIHKAITVYLELWEQKVLSLPEPKMEKIEDLANNPKEEEE